MGQEFSSIFQLEKKRLLWLVGITFALILAFQYFELPYGNIQPSVFSADNIPTPDSSRFQVADSPSAPGMHNNMTISNQTNSTGKHPLEIFNNTMTSEGKDTISRSDSISNPGKVSNNSLGFGKSDGSSTVEIIRVSDNSSATEQAGNIGMDLTREVNTTSGSDHKSVSSYANFHSPSHAIAPTYLTPPVSPPTKVSPNIAPPVLSNESGKTDSIKDERFRPLQDDVNIMNKNSSITSVPKKTKDSHRPVPEITPISEMEKSLLQNHASHRSMVYE